MPVCDTSSLVMMLEDVDGVVVSSKPRSQGVHMDVGEMNCQAMERDDPAYPIYALVE
jgi:Zn-finger nucleic acid-binding protein